MSIKLSLIRNTGAGIWAKSSGVLVKLLQVPVLIAALGVEEYGQWLVLSSLSSWLTVANMGFGTSAANEMSIAISMNDLDKAKSVFSTTMALVTLIGITGMLVVAAIAPFIPWQLLLSIPSRTHSELVWTIIWLSNSTFLSFSLDAAVGRFRAARKAHMAMFLGSFRQWFDLLFILAAVYFGKGFDKIAFSLFVSTATFYLLYQWLSWRAIREITYSFKCVEVKKFKELFRKGMAFQAFPLGNALLFQGNLLIVQTFIGPSGVAIFGTVRTLVRTVNQGMELINQAIWPEMSYLFGSKDFKKAAKLNRFGIITSFTLAIIGTLALAIFGKPLYELWVNNNIQLSQSLLILFLLPIPFNALWYTSSVVHLASNNPEGIAKHYLLATCLATIFCVILTITNGINGAAISTLVADITLIPYVVKTSISLTHENWKSFLKNLRQEVGAIPAQILTKLNLVIAGGSLTKK